jgi:16S rRNA (guanine(966)-N(2))-methyltransferase RsmD
MRIIAGAKRGMKLLSPETSVSRPITDRVKESLFNVLWNYGFPKDKIVADLFCGVGSLGLEALSREAEFVTFVEKDLKIVATLKKNIEKAGFRGESKVIRADAFKVGAPVSEQKYDLVFVDPPYLASKDTKEDSPLSKLLILLTEQLSPEGIVVVRTEKRIELLKRYGLLRVIERRQWGTMVVTILQRSNE